MFNGMYLRACLPLVSTPPRLLLRQRQLRGRRGTWSCEFPDY